MLFYFILFILTRQLRKTNLQALQTLSCSKGQPRTRVTAIKRKRINTFLSPEPTKQRREKAAGSFYYPR